MLIKPKSKNRVFQHSLIPSLCPRFSPPRSSSSVCHSLSFAATVKFSLMSAASGLLRGSRALFAAARAGSTLSKPDVSASAGKKAAGAAAAAKKSAPKKRKVTNSGITREIPVSATLQSVVGVEQISRAQASKKLWEYIKLHNLQNPSDKREILCDAKLKKLFNKEKVGFLEVAKLLSPHFLKTN